MSRNKTVFREGNYVVCMLALDILLTRIIAVGKGGVYTWLHVLLIDFADD